MRRFLAVCVLLLLAGTSSFADGESRPATPEEERFLVKAYSTVEKALAKGAPTGWEETERTQIYESTTTRVTAGYDGPLNPSFYLSWSDAEKAASAVADRDKALSESIEANAEELRAVQAKFQELMDKAVEASQKGDAALAAKYEKEMNALAKKMDAGIGEKVETSFAEGSKDAFASVGASINADDTGANSATKPIKAIAGYPAFRLYDGAIDSGGNWAEGKTCVLVGKWKGYTDAGLKGQRAELNLKAKNVRVQTLMVCSVAEEKRAAQILGNIDWALLNSLVGD